MLDLSAIERRASHIKLLLMDCDGVLTDGRFWLLNNGDEQKGFHVHDGLGLELWHRAGMRSGIISGRKSDCRRTTGARLEDRIRSGKAQKTSSML